MGEEKVKVEKNNIQILHETAGQEYDLGTYEEFTERMSDAANRKVLWETVGEAYELGTFEEFEVRLDLKKKGIGGTPADITESNGEEYGYRTHPSPETGEVNLADSLASGQDASSPVVESEHPAVEDETLRLDGTKKGNGFLGGLKRPDGRVSSELSIGIEFDGNETQIPTLVPTLEQDEVDYLLATQPDKIFTEDPVMYEGIQAKAVAHAKERMAAGKSPFADEGDIVKSANLIKSEEKFPKLNPLDKQTWGDIPVKYLQALSKGMGIGISGIFDVLDKVQTSTMKGLGSAVLGDEFNEAVDAGVFGRDRPFKAMSELATKTIEGVETPDDIVGRASESLGTIVPEIMTAHAFPTVKAGQWLAKYGYPTLDKFTLYLAGKGGIEGAVNAEGKSLQEQFIDPLVGAAKGAIEGTKYFMMGGISNGVANKIGAKLFGDAQTALKRTTGGVTGTAVNSFLFAGDAGAREYIETGSVSRNTVVDAAALGVGLGIQNALVGRAVNSFVAADRKTINAAMESERTPKEMKAEAEELVKQVEAERSKDKPIDQDKEDATLLEAAILDNAANIKAIGQTIVESPEQIKLTIDQSLLPDGAKADLKDKADMVFADNDPRVQKAKPFTDEIDDINKQIESVANNKFLSDTDKTAQIAPLQEKVKGLVEKVNEVYGPEVESKPKPEQKEAESKDEVKEKKEGPKEEPIKEKKPESVQPKKPFTSTETEKKSEQPDKPTPTFEEFKKSNSQGRFVVVGSRIRGEEKPTSDYDLITQLTPEEVSNRPKNWAISASWLPKEILDKWKKVREGRKGKTGDVLVAYPTGDINLVYVLSGTPSRPKMTRVGNEKSAGMGFPKDTKESGVLDKVWTTDATLQYHYKNRYGKVEPVKSKAEPAPNIPASDVFKTPKAKDGKKESDAYKDKAAQYDEGIKDPKFKEDHLTTETIKVEDLRHTQDELVLEKIEKSDTEGEPTLIKVGNEYHIEDGHHRIAKQIKDGKTEIKAEVFGGEKKATPKPKAESPKEPTPPKPKPPVKKTGPPKSSDKPVEKGSIQDLQTQLAKKEITQKEYDTKAEVVRKENGVGKVIDGDNKLVKVNDEVVELSILPQPVKEKVRKFAKKYFTAAGLLPTVVFESLVRSKSKIKAELERMRDEVNDLRRGAKKAYGKVGDAEKRQIDEALHDVTKIPELPEAVQEPLTRLRAKIDYLTKGLIKSGLIEGDLVVKMANNLGLYVTRTYKVHDNPKKWGKNVPDEVVTKARNFIEQEYKEAGYKITEEELDGEINSLLKDAGMDHLEMLAKQAGRMKFDVLKKRKDVPKEIRDLLGEWNDPFVNVTKTITKMTTLLENYKFLNEIASQNDGKYFFDKKTGENYVEVGSSASMGPLKGKFTTPEIKEALAETVKTVPDWVSTWMKINGTAKYSKTILSPITHIRNFTANFLLQIGNGRFRLNKLGDATKRMYDEFGKGDKSKLRELTELGVIHDNARAGELADVMKDAMGYSGDVEKFYESRLKTIAKKGGSAVERLYQAEDDFHKVYAYENELSDLKKAYKGSDKYTESELKELAAKKVRATMPTYSMVPETIKQIRRLPLVGSFVSFPAEIFRNMFNIVEIGVKEMKIPEERSIGIKRLAGFASALAIPAAITAYFRYKNDIGPDEDDLLSLFFPTWSENSQILVLSKDNEKGIIKYVDVSYSDPYNYAKKPLIAAYREEDTSQAMWAALKEFSTPFIGEEIMTTRMVDIMRNKKKSNGRPVYNEQADAGDKFVDAMNYLWQGVEPGAISQVQRFFDKDKDWRVEAAAMGTGLRMTTIDIPRSIRFKAIQYGKEVSEARGIFYASANPDRNSPAAILKSHDKAQKAYRRIFDEFSHIVRSALELGVEPGLVINGLVEGGVGKKEAVRLVNGTFQHFSASKENQVIILNAQEGIK